VPEQQVVRHGLRPQLQDVPGDLQVRHARREEGEDETGDGGAAADARETVDVQAGARREAAREAFHFEQVPGLRRARPVVVGVLEGEREGGAPAASTAGGTSSCGSRMLMTAVTSPRSGRSASPLTLIRKGAVLCVFTGVLLR